MVYVYGVAGMQNLGVRTAESYDERGASRFHCFNPGTHLHGGYPDWYLQYDSHGAKFVSINLCSRKHAVSSNVGLISFTFACHERGTNVTHTQ